ncbi:hypothetical protein GQ55_4G349400 [Panicum hallii var. hallii]|jgi:hypothetical protein|uniref:Uncharacterized protein n=1 Tax=Panicum hallii var. hallii TaxID=1504633 RepID=A0A2T7E3D0_9POAL|nr:uncharacterized protein LOC112890862 [Panicum hallii]PUZ62343.1 hypothetical protein GQ55_4G349400 [Panicum hallii var. hallii]
MERLLTSLVFCEAPLDFAYGTPAGTGARFAADSSAGAGSSRPAEGAAETTRRVAVKAALRKQQPELAPAFDGLNCFETVVMPSRSSH